MRFGGEATVRQRFQFAENLDGLARKRDDVLLAHLHALGGDAPFRLFEIDLRPLRLPQFARPSKDEGCQPEGAFGREEAFVRINRPEQCANALRLDDGGEMLLLRRRKGTAQIARGVALRSTRQ
jgi:hypothetical protein